MNGYRAKHGSSQPLMIGRTPAGYHGKHQRKNRRRRRLKFVLIVVVLICLAWPFLEAHMLTVDRITLTAEDLSSEIGQLRVVYLSDIHYGFYYSDRDLQRLVSKINQLKPDLVLFGGGYGTDNASAIRFFRNMPSIHARYAMLGVIGDTDRGEDEAALTNLEDAMREAGVTPLVNEVKQVFIGNGGFVTVAGLDDPNAGTPDISGVSSRVSATDYVILLCHSPVVIPDTQLATDASDRLSWYDLGLFGHTHGGQMALFSPLLDLAAEVPERYRSGLLKENRTDLLISHGVGTLEFPARLFCFPQIHEINLNAD